MYMTTIGFITLV